MELGATMTEPQIDAHLIEACRLGDREAFRRLFDAYKDRVFTIALRFLKGDATAAEDVTQDVFLRLYTRIGQYRREADFMTWLYRMIVNACIDEMRRNRRLVRLTDPEALSRESQPMDAPVRSEVVGEVQEALSELGPEMRMTVLLKYYEDLSYQEMASALGCSKGTIASRLNRCHRILARRLSHLRDASAHGDR